MFKMDLKHKAAILVPTIERGENNGHIFCEQPL